MFTPASSADSATTMCLNELNIGELFVVSSLRLWLLARVDSGGSYPDWRQGFVHAGIEAGAAEAFHSLCQMLVSSARQPLLVHRLPCPALASHESWLLQLVGLLQRDRADVAERVIASYCAPSAARLALSPAVEFSRALGARRLWVDLHGCPAGMQTLQSIRCAQRTPESSRLH